MSKKLKIGLFGFGCVGQGLYHVLNNSTGFKADIVKIAVRDKTKKRIVPADLITYEKKEILENPEIDVVVELIDDAEEAFLIVSEALKRKKHVVTANKKMLAHHLKELYQLQRENNVSLLYEASVGGSIPILRTLEEYFDNEELEKVSGILNGTSNYILTKTISEGQAYSEALKQAQQNGYAESDPTNDVEGYDPKFKAIIVALHAFGLIIPVESILNVGITSLQDEDIQYAREKNYKIKLTPVIQRLSNNEISVFVLPRFVTNSSQLFNIENEYNGVVVEGSFSGEQFLQGKGAGSYPTGAAVLSDISALSYGYRYGYKKHVQKHAFGFTNNVEITIYLRYNKSEDLELLGFTKILQKFEGGTYNYVTGKIPVANLIKHREYLLANKLFISLLNDTVTLSSPKPGSHFKKEVPGKALAIEVK